ncbi:hypothetical protein GCM10009557_10270 [Virgisporangium ochraceum]|uniref:Uncharacterized protein n=1 Tax=Virgisporangium ochraceum TaxID=65505 RepID=A0A8J4EIH1_9ACTN|nr:hypothetical protein [Virgisporangium ochraceum]GIJ73257.1 hypothetical protein Voc01_081740 [Virgisporangium ochraceum]
MSQIDAASSAEANLADAYANALDWFCRCARSFEHEDWQALSQQVSRLAAAASELEAAAAAASECETKPRSRVILSHVAKRRPVYRIVSTTIGFLLNRSETAGKRAPA